VQSLQGGEEQHDTLTVKSTDGTEHVIDVTVVGTNDAAVITFDAVSFTDTGSNTSDHITNNNAVTLSGTYSDIDGSVTQVQVFNGVTPVGFATLSAGTWILSTTLADGTYNQLRVVATDNTAATSQATNPTQIVVDTQNPTVSTVSINDTKITDADATLTRTATITFSEAMDQTSTPVISNNAGTTLTSPTGGHWVNSTQYAINYTVADNNVSLTDITFNVSGAKDLAGNTQTTASNVSSGVAVDTQNPIVVISTIAQNTTTITGTTSERVSTMVIFDDLNKDGVQNNGETALTGTFNPSTTPNGQGTFNWTFTSNTNPVNKDVYVAVATDLAGNTGSSPGKAAPAGIAGEPINLGLTSLDGEGYQLLGVALRDVPSGWLLTGATQNADGSWTLHTGDVRDLTVTTPTDFIGAMVLQVETIWASADGTTKTVVVADNVEAYAPGSPIFAWSGDDHLTGSTGADQFVFSQPIGHDVIHSFDVSQDRIDLIGYHGDNGTALNYADMEARLSEDSAGNAVITLADGQSITLDGVHAADLTEANFEFDVTPVMNNAGTMTIGDGAMLPLSGIINNTGTIGLNSEGSGTLLQLIQYGITLQGDGQIVLSDDAGNVITGTLSGVNLINVDNTISGAGQLGAGQLDLDNAGDIIATGTHALVIDTGDNVIENTGTLEATGSGGLVIDSDLDNSGLVWAHGANVTFNGAASGSGSLQVDGVSTVDFGSVASIATALAADATAKLVLHDSFDFSGVISGLDGNDRVDFADIMFATGVTLDYTANQNGTGGVLHVSDGAHEANINLLGQYDVGGFSTTSDELGGTLVSYDPNHH
jgi:Big-like domain-containing protein